MKSHFVTATLAATSFAALVAILAFSDARAVEPIPGARIGTAPAEARAKLAESGFHMVRFQRGPEVLAITAIRLGRRVKAYVDPKTGEILRLARNRGAARAP